MSYPGMSDLADWAHHDEAEMTDLTYRAECAQCACACSSSRPEITDRWADDHVDSHPDHVVSVSTIEVGL